MFCLAALNHIYSSSLKWRVDGTVKFDSFYWDRGPNSKYGNTERGFYEKDKKDNTREGD